MEKIIAIKPMINVSLCLPGRKSPRGRSGMNPFPIALNIGSLITIVPVPIVTRSSAPRKIKPAAMVETKAGTPSLATGVAVSIPASIPKTITAGMTANTGQPQKVMAMAAKAPRKPAR